MKTTSFKSSRFTKVKKGQKISTELRPEVKVGTGFNKLSLNGMASGILGARHGDYVEIFVDEEATDVNNMFGIAVSSEELGGMKIANPGKSKEKGKVQNFNYSQIYSQLLQATPGAVALSKEALVEAGLMRIEETQMNKDKSKMCKTERATRYVAYEVSTEGSEEEFEIEDVNGETKMVTYTIYPLINVKIKDREIGAGEDAASDEGLE